MSVAWVLLILKCIMNSEFKILKTNKMMTNSLSYRHISRKIILEKKLLMLDEICRTYTRVSGLGAEDATPLDLQLMLQPTNVIIYGTKAKAGFRKINDLLKYRDHRENVIILVLKNDNNLVMDQVFKSLVSSFGIGLLRN